MIYSFVNFNYYFIYVVTAFYLVPYLLEKDISLIVSGYLFSLSLLLVVVVGTLVSIAADKYKNNKEILILTTLWAIAGIIILLLGTNKVLLAVAYLITMTAILTQSALIDGLVLKIKASKYHQVRAFGSFGAASSYFLAAFGFVYFPFQFILLLVALLLIIHLIVMVSIDVQVDNIRLKTKDLKAIFSNQKIIVLLLVTMLTYGVLAADDAYNYVYNIQIVGLGALTYGIVGGISILMEGFVIYTNNYNLSSRFRINFLLGAIGLLLLIYLTRFLLVDYKLVIILGNIFLGLFVGLFIPNMIMLLNSSSEQQTKTVVMGAYQGVIRLGGVVFSYVTAVFFSKYEVVEFIYVLHFGLILMGLILMWYYKKIN